mgnify:FL=1
MRKFIVTLCALLAFVVAANGQVQQSADTVVASSDSTVFESLGSSVVASDSLQKSMQEYIAKNPSRNVSVFRLRIFFDNKRDARAVSEQVMSEFQEIYPSVPVFRGYSNPYFKVTVGNFRSKSEAMKFLNEIKSQYPSVFLVKEVISSTN